jgi:hypothetical protein
MDIIHIYVSLIDYKKLLNLTWDVTYIFSFVTRSLTEMEPTHSKLFCCL